jgi:hypothetical protein
LGFGTVCCLLRQHRSRYYYYYHNNNHKHKHNDHDYYYHNNNDVYYNIHYHNNNNNNNHKHHKHKHNDHDYYYHNNNDVYYNIHYHNNHKHHTHNNYHYNDDEHDYYHNNSRAAPVHVRRRGFWRVCVGDCDVRDCRAVCVHNGGVCKCDARLRCAGIVGGSQCDRVRRRAPVRVCCRWQLDDHELRRVADHSVPAWQRRRDDPHVQKLDVEQH